MFRPPMLTVAALTGLLACGVQSSPSVSPAPPSPSASVPSYAPPSPTPSPTTPTTPTLAPSSPSKASPTGPLRIGARGAEVVRLQNRLTALGYWLGSSDGVFGETTRQAVYALQHAAQLEVDGAVGVATRKALAQGVVPTARSRFGTVLEIDVEDQVLLLVRDGRLKNILHVSTGGGYLYVDRDVYVRASTPRGEFAVTRLVDGWDVSRLGRLWRPAYFTGGYAVHGYEWVPPYPASHGCVRVSIAAMNWLWETGRIGVGVQVWVY